MRTQLQNKTIHRLAPDPDGFTGSVSQQEISQLKDFDTILRLWKFNVTGNDDLFVNIFYTAEGGKFPFSGGGIVHGFGYLDIDFLIGAGGYEVYCLVPDLPNCDIVTAAEKLKINNVFDDVSSVHITQTQQIVAQPDIANIILSQEKNIGVCAMKSTKLYYILVCAMKSIKIQSSILSKRERLSMATVEVLKDKMLSQAQALVNRTRPWLAYTRNSLLAQ